MKTHDQFIFSGNPSINKIRLVKIEVKAGDIFEAFVEIDPDIAATDIQAILLQTSKSYTVNGIERCLKRALLKKFDSPHFALHQPGL